MVWTRLFQCELRRSVFVLPHLVLHSFGQSGHLDDTQFVGAAGDLLVFVVGFDLKRDLRTVGIDHPRSTDDFDSQRRRRRMFDVEEHADGAFTRLQQGEYGFSCGMFQKPDQPGSGEYLGHAVVSEVNRVQRTDSKEFFAYDADSWSVFHGASFLSLMRGDDTDSQSAG